MRQKERPAILRRGPCLLYTSLFEAYEAGVANRGKAKVGEKTFIDGIHPAVESLNAAAALGAPLEEMAAGAVKAAEDGFKSTTTMLAVRCV